MGIRSLFSVLREMCPAAFSQHQLERKRGSNTAPLPYHNLYYDVNNAVYRFRATARSPEHFFVRLFSEIDLVSRWARPKAGVYCAMDGPGPRAKVTTQLERRRGGPGEGAGGTDKKETSFPALGFTPGTVVMQQVKEALCVLGGERVRNRQMAYYISGSDSAGEGESKCFQHMRTLASHRRCLVVGNDSDLVAYSLLASPKVDLMRLVMGNKYELIDTDEIKRSLASAVLGPREVGKITSYRKMQRVADDFVMLAILNGNDYIPAVGPYSLQNAWRAYCRVKTGDRKARDRWFFDSSKNTIDWEFAAQFLAQAGSVKKSLSRRVAPSSPKSNQPGIAHARSVLQLLCAQLQLSNPEYEARGSLRDGTREEELRLADLQMSVVGRGRSKSMAKTDAVMQVLAPESPIWGLLEKVDKARYRRCYAYLEELDGMIGHLERQLQREVPFKLPEAPKIAEVPQHVVQRTEAGEASAEQRMQDYFHGMIWTFNYYRGLTNDYGYLFPHGGGIDVSELVQAAPTVREGWDSESAAKPPLSPIALALSLLPGEHRKLLPAPYNSIAFEEDKQTGYLFEDKNAILLEQRRELNVLLDEVEKVAHSVPEEQLSPMARHLLKLHDPVVFLRRDHPALQNKRQEVRQHEYLPPTMPQVQGETFQKLGDAQPNGLMFSGVLSKQQRVRLGGPYIAKRAMSFMRVVLR